MRTVDKVALGALIGLALTGPTLVRRTLRAVDPSLAVDVAWHEAGAGPPILWAPPAKPPPPPTVLDPWGQPFAWLAVPDRRWLVRGPGQTGASVLAPEEGSTYYAHSHGSGGPIGVGRRVDFWPVARPRWTALALVVEVALLWRLTRPRRRAIRRAVAPLALVTLPVGVLAWELFRGGHLPAGWQVPLLAVPVPVAASVTLWALVFLLALGARAWQAA